jgi:hypothetical protein
MFEGEGLHRNHRQLPGGLRATAYTLLYAAGHIHANRYADCCTIRYHDEHGYCDGCCHWHGDGHKHGDVYCDSYIHWHSDQYGNWHRDGHEHGDLYRDSYIHKHRHGDIYCDSYIHWHSDQYGDWHGDGHRDIGGCR